MTGLRCSVKSVTRAVRGARSGWPRRRIRPAARAHFRTRPVPA